MTLLYEYPVQHLAYRTSDPDAARSNVSEAFASHELHLHRSARLDLQVDIAFTPEVAAARMAYGADITILGPPMLNRYHFNLPVLGDVTAEQHGSRVQSEGGRAGIVFRPDAPFYLHMSAESQQVHVSVPRERLEAHAARLMGARHPGEVEFDVACDLSTASGQALFATASFCHAELARPGGIGSIPAAARDLESTILTQILMTVPSQVTTSLQFGPEAPRRSIIRQVLRHIEENPANDLTIADLVELSGLSARALQHGFREEVGVSPVTHVRNVRLDRVRRDIEISVDPIADIAGRWRFFHLGRFAAQYRERFGELPSETRTNAHGYRFSPEPAAR